MSRDVTIRQSEHPPTDRPDTAQPSAPADPVEPVGGAPRPANQPATATAAELLPERGDSLPAKVARPKPPAVAKTAHATAKRKSVLPKRRRRPAVPPQPSLLLDPTFRQFFLERLISQTGQGAILYALLIVVTGRTGSSFYAALFVICSNIPAILFGLPAGIVVDSVPRQPLLVMLNLLRCAFALSLVVQTPGLPGIFAATLGLWTIHQFHSPSESAALASLVPPKRYTSAQALANLALTLAQALGLVILAPLLLKIAGPRAVFGAAALLFVVAAFFAALLPRLDEHVRGAVARRHPHGVKESLLTGWRAARSDHITFEAIANDVLVSVGLSALVVIMPIYLKNVLGTGAENTVFVFAPAALGLIVGLRLAPKISHWLEERRTVLLGLVIFALCVAAFGFVDTLYTSLNDRLGVPLDRFGDLVHIPPLIVLAMLISIPAGFASALVSVTARALLLMRTAPALRGQVIATQSLVGNMFSLIPTLLAGITADLVGVQPIAVVIAVIIAVGAFAAHTSTHRPIPVPSTSP